MIVINSLVHFPRRKFKMKRIVCFSSSLAVAVVLSFALAGPAFACHQPPTTTTVPGHCHHHRTPPSTTVPPVHKKTPPTTVRPPSAKRAPARTVSVTAPAVVTTASSYPVAAATDQVVPFWSQPAHWVVLSSFLGLLAFGFFVTTRRLRATQR
jgi:hypothetical protein